MVDVDLFEEHQLLRRKLRLFIDQARENELKMKRFHEQELNLIRTRRLSDLVKNVLWNYREAFALDAVTLMLYDPEYELQRILEDDGVQLEEQPNLLFTGNRERLDSLFGVSMDPVLGAYNDAEHFFFFSNSPPTQSLGSVALLPLIRYGELIGSLNLGSNSLERFTNESGTIFLQRLATIVAICLENAANNERLKRVGLTDPLTGINNRRFFDQRIHEEIARSVRAQNPLACLFVDIDHFKLINDTHGHQSDDHVLRDVARLIREQLRNSDVIARYGGEEFAVLLTNTRADVAVEIAERVRERVARNTFLIPETEKTLTITISIGVSSLDSVHDLEDASTLSKRLIDRADSALYDAKSSGRNRVVLSEQASDSTPDKNEPSLSYTSKPVFNGVDPPSAH